MACGCNQGCGCGGCQRPNKCERALHQMKNNAQALTSELEKMEGYVNGLKQLIAEAEANCVEDEDDNCGCANQCGGCRPQPRCGCGCANQCGGCRPEPRCGCGCANQCGGCRPEPRCGRC